MTIDLIASKKWRMNHLYRIINKNGDSVPFVLNKVQANVLENLHSRNLILKARQLGMSTFAVLYILDEALFNEHLSAGIVSYSLEHAQHIFKRIIGHAIDSLTPMAANFAGIVQRSAREITFSNGSFLRVDTTLRGGAYQLVLVSEFGKTCARDPMKAEEVVTGTLQTVPMTGRIIIESTGEGNAGFYADLVQSAVFRGNEKLSKLEYKLHFFPWYCEPEYSMDGDIKVDTVRNDYFDKIGKDAGITILPGQRRWYYHQMGVLGDKIKQEFPSCISADVPVLYDEGILDIKSISANNRFVKNHFYQGRKTVYRITTSLGYSLKCTLDHQIKTPNGFVEAENLKVADTVCLSHGDFCDTSQRVELSTFPIANHYVFIDEEIASFLGYFIGDGSFYEDALSIACDSQDQDVVQHVIALIKSLFGLDAYTRIVGDKKGCTEIRISKKEFKPFFQDLGVIKRVSGRVKRKVIVPDYIKKSPKSVVAAFLRTFFESDGHAAKSGVSVKAFSKYKDFMRDIQLLLLQFGITSRVIEIEKLASGKKYPYVGYELALRKEESVKYNQQIGFVSQRKTNRISQNQDIKYCGNQISLKLEDTIKSIEFVGEEDVYDLTTSSGEFSAGGVTVHNCVTEAFISSSDAYYFQSCIEEAYQSNRMLQINPMDNVEPVYVAMDIGVNDLTVIIFFQVVHGEIRIIDYYENKNQGVEHYARHLQQEKKYIYHTIFLPHDAAHRDGLVVENTYARDFNKFFAQTGTRVVILKRTDKSIQISNAKNKFSRCVFNLGRVKPLVVQLGKYRKKWSEQYGKYLDEPFHDSSSNYADAFQYMCAAVNHIETVLTKAGSLEKHRAVVENRAFKI